MATKKKKMGMLARMKNDVRVICERDPAPKSKLEIVLNYPGLHAIWLHRIAHFFYKRRLYLIARVISHISRFLTQVEIHPGAVLGDGLFIDHGCGVVIGETCEIGENVTVFQGVTLGGSGKEKGKRHPTIGDNVVVSTGAKVLGSFRVGDNAKVGAGSVVLKAVPDHCTVVGIPGRVIAGHRPKDKYDIDLRHDQMPDPIREMFDLLQDRIQILEARINELEYEIDENNPEGQTKEYNGCYLNPDSDNQQEEDKS